MEKKQMLDLIDKVESHLLSQGPCMAGDFGMYRNEGKSCAIGILLKSYDPSIEGIPVTEPEVHNRLPFMPSPKDLKILLSLQRLHDEVDRGDWKHHFKKIRQSVASESEVPTNHNRRRKRPSKNKRQVVKGKK